MTNKTIVQVSCNSYSYPIILSYFSLVIMNLSTWKLYSLFLTTNWEKYKIRLKTYSLRKLFFIMGERWWDFSLKMTIFLENVLTLSNHTIITKLVYLDFRTKNTIAIGDECIYFHFFWCMSNQRKSSDHFDKKFPYRIAKKHWF